MMTPKFEFVGTVQFWLTGARGNPVALYLEKLENGECRISARLPEWRHVAGVGATANKAAENTNKTQKQGDPPAGAYEALYGNGGIKAEKPPPPKPAAVGSPATPSQGTAPASS